MGFSQWIEHQKMKRRIKREVLASWKQTDALLKQQKREINERIMARVKAALTSHEDEETWK